MPKKEQPVSEQKKFEMADKGDSIIIYGEKSHLIEIGVKWGLFVDTRNRQGNTEYRKKILDAVVRVMGT